MEPILKSYQSKMWRGLIFLILRKIPPPQYGWCGPSPLPSLVMITALLAGCTRRHPLTMGQVIKLEWQA